MRTEELKHLWDGSEPGWTLRKHSDSRTHLVFHFLPPGPDSKAITLRRQFVPELMAMTLPAVHHLVKGCVSYRTREAYGNIEAHRLKRKAGDLGFQVSAEVIIKVTYLPMRDDNVVALIEDEELAVELARGMIEAGVPVVEVHSD